MPKCKIHQFILRGKLEIVLYNIMIAGIPFVLVGQLKANTPHYIHFFLSYPLLRHVR
jgi:hypothetical protein